MRLGCNQHCIVKSAQNDPRSAILTRLPPKPKMTANAGIEATATRVLCTKAPGEKRAMPGAAWEAMSRTVGQDKSCAIKLCNRVFLLGLTRRCVLSGCKSLLDCQRVNVLQLLFQSTVHLQGYASYTVRARLCEIRVIRRVNKWTLWVRYQAVARKRGLPSKLLGDNQSHLEGSTTPARAYFTRPAHP